jgi:hypothetical protein
VLRNVVAAQDKYRATHPIFATSVEALQVQAGLEKLQRDLGDASDACRDGDPNCRGRAERSGDDLGRMAGRQQSTESLRQPAKKR